MWGEHKRRDWAPEYQTINLKYKILVRALPLLMITEQPQIPDSHTHAI